MNLQEVTTLALGPSTQGLYKYIDGKGNENLWTLGLQEVLA